jgi:ribosome recycling factor
MIKEAMQDAKEKMGLSVSALKEDLAAIRTGRANPALVNKITVEYYGANTPLLQLASISIPEPRQIMIKPFDPSTVKDIEKAILSSNIGVNPNSDGKVIRLNLPALTEDRRKEIVKIVQKRAEDARISSRNIRRDLIKDIREYEEEKMITEDEMKRGEDDAQKLTDETIKSIDKISDAKEKDVMEV